MPVEPSLVEIVTAGIDARLHDVYVSLPATVQSYDPSDSTVNVVAQVRVPIETEDGGVANETLPVIPDVPVLWMKWGGGAITFPIAPGDTGLLLIVSYSISQWLDTGQLSDPGDVRANHVSNCVFIPGLSPKAALPTYKNESTDLVIEALGIRLGGAAIQKVARADKVADKINDVIGALNAVQYLPGPGPAVNLFSAPITPVTAADVASEKVSCE